MAYILQGGKARGKTAYFAGFQGGEAALADDLSEAFIFKDKRKIERQQRVLHRMGYYMVVARADSKEAENKR